MAALGWSRPVVESIPGKVSGAWGVQGTRLPVATVIEKPRGSQHRRGVEQFDVTRERCCSRPTGASATNRTCKDAASQGLF